MARPKAAVELEALRRQQIELAQKIKEAEARERQREKADTERRERIAGRILLAHLAAHPDSTEAKVLRALLDAALTKPADRALFDLPASEASAAPADNAVTDSALPPQAAAEAVEQLVSFAEGVGG